MRYRTLVLLVILLVLSNGVHAVTYCIDSTLGNDLNPGSIDSPWKTIGKANSMVNPGDTAIIAQGTYDEAINPSKSGSPSAPITYVAKPGIRPVIRQAALQYRQYIRVIGFEITHNSTKFNRAVTLYGVNHSEIINNYIHHTYQNGIRNNGGSYIANYNVIRGNTISYTGCPTGLAGYCTGANGIDVAGNHNLFEYNDISHTLDFIDTYGGYNIIRNNYFHDFKNSDFPDGSGDSAHVDIWQPYDAADNPFLRNVFENNLAADNIEKNSHFNQLRDEDSSGEKDVVVRGNLAYRIGSYVAQFGGIDYARVYSNTFLDFGYAYADNLKSTSAIGFTNENVTDVSRNNSVFNNIFYKAARPASNDIIAFSAGSDGEVSNNACEYGNDSGCNVMSNINFMDYANDNFYLQSSSAARNEGRMISSVISSSASGTYFTVPDAGFFVCGLDVKDPTGKDICDSIRVGSNNPVNIVNIDYQSNMITVDEPITWATGDPIVLSHQSITPTIGAYEYKTDYTYDVSLNSPTVISPGVLRLDAAIANPDNVRYVEFYVDNVPISAVSSAPYLYDWNAGNSIKTYDFKAVAYSRFADKTLSKMSSINYTYNYGGESVCAGNFTIPNSSTIAACSCDQTAVQAAINNASDGMTVMVPAGNCTWTSNSCVQVGNYCSPLFINKSVRFIGSGVDKTILNDSTNGSWNRPAIVVDCDPSTSVEISGFTFSGKGGTEGSIRVMDCSKYLRIHHNKFIQISGQGVSRGVVLRGRITGLIDNNTFFNVGNEHIDVEGDGVSSWKDSFSSIFGTKNAVFIEDNYWSYNSSFTENGANTVDANDGGRFVYRKNKVDSWQNSQPIEVHGWMLAGNISAGVRSFEIYHNEFNILNSSYTAWNAIRIRGGEGVIFNNSLTGKWANEIRLEEERTHMSRPTIPPNCTYVNTNDSATWEMPDRPCRDQVHNLFIWNISLTNPPFDLLIDYPEVKPYIVENRDYFLRAPSKESDNIDYVPYIYPHPFTFAPFGTTICGEGSINLSCWCEGMKTGGSGFCCHGYFKNEDCSAASAIIPGPNHIRADANKDCSIDDAELNLFIGKWIEGIDDVSMDEMMDILRKWLLGSEKYCIV